MSQVGESPSDTILSTRAGFDESPARLRVARQRHPEPFVQGGFHLGSGVRELLERLLHPSYQRPDLLCRHRLSWDALAELAGRAPSAIRTRGSSSFLTSVSRM